MHKHSDINIEAILKLKRYEKPDPKVWDRFDYELKQRMLQSVVRNPGRASWPSVSRVLRFVARPKVAACVALAVIAQLNYTAFSGRSGASLPFMKALFQKSASVAALDLPSGSSYNFVASSFELDEHAGASLSFTQNSDPFEFDAGVFGGDHAQALMPSLSAWVQPANSISF